ncbi:Rha family transcriptional regulator [Megamonas funiformis]|uniref:Rha family transcriptional regulator n=1 Tax=Megamonas funiformis TaxID=437897 RepID=UPI003F84FCA0
MNELVEIINNKIVVSSRQIAAHFKKEHKNVLRDIENIIKETKFGSSKLSHEFFLKSTFENRGKQYPMYIMNRDGFSLLVMGFTGKEALEWKIKYINAFNKMEAKLKRIEKENQQKAIERAVSKEVRRTLTDTIKELVPESPHKCFAYSNYTNLIYKILFGLSAKAMRDLMQLERQDNIRDKLNLNDLKRVKELEALVYGLLALGWGYKDIKKFLENQHIEKLVA